MNSVEERLLWPGEREACFVDGASRREVRTALAVPPSSRRRAPPRSREARRARRCPRSSIRWRPSAATPIAASEARRRAGQRRAGDPDRNLDELALLAWDDAGPRRGPPNLASSERRAADRGAEAVRSRGRASAGHRSPRRGIARRARYPRSGPPDRARAGEPVERGARGRSSWNRGDSPRAHASGRGDRFGGTSGRDPPVSGSRDAAARARGGAAWRPPAAGGHVARRIRGRATRSPRGARRRRASGAWAALESRLRRAPVAGLRRYSSRDAAVAQW